MTSHHPPPQLFGRVPTQKPIQHHLPPLFSSPPLNTSESLPIVDTQANNICNSLRLSKMTVYDSCSLPRNCCSVSTVGSVTNTDFRHESGHSSEDAVSYIVEHQLPKLFNSMIEDLLLERPEEDVDKWMLDWFEDEYERRQDERRRRPVQQRGTYSILRRLASDEGGSSSGDSIFLQQQQHLGSLKPKMYSLPQHPSSMQTSRTLNTEEEEEIISTRQRNDMSLMQCAFFNYTPLHVPALPQHGAGLLPHGELCPPTDNPVVRTFTAKCSLPALQEQRQLSATCGSGGAVGPCGGGGGGGGDCRLRLRSPRTVEISGSDESFTSSMT